MFSQGRRILGRSVSKSVIETIHNTSSQNHHSKSIQSRSTQFLPRCSFSSRNTLSTRSFSATIKSTNSAHIPSSRHHNKIPSSRNNSSTAASPTSLNNSRKYYTSHHSSTTIPSIEQPLNNASLALTALLGGSISAGVYATIQLLSSPSNEKYCSFEDLSTTLLDHSPPANDPDASLKFFCDEYSIRDYEKIVALPDRQMSKLNKLLALQELQKRHLEQTVPLFHLIYSNVVMVNALIYDRIKLQYFSNAKLVHRVTNQPIDQEYIQNRINKDFAVQQLTSEQIQQLHRILFQIQEINQHELPSAEQLSQASATELDDIYASLTAMYVENAAKLDYFKFYVLVHDLENATDDRQLISRLDTQVTKSHNRLSNAFTDVVDHLTTISDRTRLAIYREKGLEVLSSVISELDYFVENIPKINETMYENIREQIYSEARANKREAGADENDLDIQALDAEVDAHFQSSRLLQELIEPIMETFHDMWLRVHICDSWMTSSLPDSEVPEILDALRNTYLEARERSFIPLYFMADYQLQRPLEYNHLLNTVYLTLPKHALDERIAQRIQAIWQQQDADEEEKRKQSLELPQNQRQRPSLEDSE